MKRTALSLSLFFITASILVAAWHSGGGAVTATTSSQILSVPHVEGSFYFKNKSATEPVFLGIGNHLDQAKLSEAFRIEPQDTFVFDKESFSLVTFATSNGTAECVYGYYGK